MRHPLRARRAIAFATLVMWCAVASAASFWLLQCLTPQPDHMSALLPETPLYPPRQSSPLRRWLGSMPTQALQVQVLGLIAAGPHHSSAILSVNGAPPTAYAVGQTLMEGMKLSNVMATGIKVIQADGVELSFSAPVMPKASGIDVVHPLKP